MANRNSDSRQSQDRRNRNNRNIEEDLRGVNQRTDQKGEAQNVNDDQGRSLTGEEAKKGAQKAMEGQRQKRDEGPSSKNAERLNDRFKK